MILKWTCLFFICIVKKQFFSKRHHVENLAYVKQRRHSKSQQRKLTRRLIHLLGKILEEIRRMMREHDGEEGLTVREQLTVDIITKVYIIIYTIRYMFGGWTIIMKINLLIYAYI